jgi:NAD(P)-dependent dehydrogenase (short-subunit alcohol dehydrogenase family)
MTESDFQNKTVCITGAGRGLLFEFSYFWYIERENDCLGIGKSLALRLAELGAKVIAVSKSDENLKQLVAEVIYLNLSLFV